MSDHHNHCEQGHHSRRSGNKRRLLLTLLLAAGYMIAEIVGGLITNSLALLADAGHMFSDVAALGLGLFAVWIAERPPNAKRTYGYYRTEILAALANGSALIAVSIYIFIEAYRRLIRPPAVEGDLMMAIAIGGLGVNLLGLWILSAGREENLNVRGAWLHVLTDALGSIGAIAAGVLIWAFGWNWADPVASALIGVLVVYSAWRLVLEAVSVLMESAPRGIDVDEVFQAMSEMPGVLGVHDLHIWTITSGMDSLSAHVVFDDQPSPMRLLGELRTMLHDRFGIDHMTIQMEPEDFEERPTAF
ncbi:MAG: cation transporter [Pirellulales bacterium]|nr:cation transporter [Pirellulales bacterium]